ncbi:DUF1499 domain-containing protein [Methylonatrum kenyense]|uniref:DUF1499 domain-containing protein n=1 Tax=Methylonatrum kenyense TaxID=455253 RepID=UPI0020BF2A59|nr:DUF1499 domain-containing protein [Methylonatrum kenyense]MCK8516321.1 DUF1499 domain-containing protein [Methylonatrum kenyense]
MSSLISRIILVFALLSALVGLLMLLLPGPAYQRELLELRPALDLFRAALWPGLGAGALGLLAALTGAGGVRGGPALCLISVLTAVIVVIPPLQFRHAAASVPPIHDISTDLAEPPEFVALRAAREDAPNAVEHPGQEVATQQRDAYPEIRPRRYARTTDAVFAAAAEQVREQGWLLVEEDPAAGRIEAVATTTWFGFRDDVIIRVQADADGSRLDMRSASRVGRSDLGTNAQRIDRFLRALDQRLQ